MILKLMWCSIPGQEPFLGHHTHKTALLRSNPVYLGNVDLDGRVVLGSNDSVARRASEQREKRRHPGGKCRPSAQNSKLTIYEGRTGPQIHQRRSACCRL